jgi:uncharacterized protein (TIGR03066 family)
MRVSTLRTPLTVLVCGLALGLAGCNSNNTDKIVGKWKVTSGLPAEAATLNLEMFIEFTADGKFSMTMNALGTNKTLSAGNYSLGSGDTVNLTNLSPPLDGKTKSKEKITITGDTMSLATDKGSMTLTRVSGTPKPAEKK